MQELPVNLDALAKEDVYSVATALLYTLKDSPRYSIVSELFYILDHNNFLNLIKYFGGMEIRIPTVDEINDLLKVILLYQYYVVEEMSWTESLTRSGFTQEESNSARMKLLSLKDLFKNQEIGSKKYE